jgi:spore maturation protein CgeB
MSAGAFLLHQYFEGMDTLLGLRDGKHLVIWNTFDDLCNKISYYLSHEAERKFIADTGCKFVKKHHSFDARVAELMERLNV